MHKPILRLDALLNDPKLGSEPLLQPNPKEGPRSAELPVQHLIILSLSPNPEESVPLLFKFGVLKVLNQARGLSHLGEGVATNLKADVQISLAGSYTEKGDFSLYDKKSRTWSDRQPLRWYHENWTSSLKPVEGGEKLKQSIVEMKRIAQYPLLLADKYLIDESKDILQVGDEAYLIVFYTQAGNRSWFYPSQRNQMPWGRYKLKIRISAYELKPQTKVYDLDVRAWNDFSLKESKELTL